MSGWLSDLGVDLRYGWRSLRRTPGLTGIAAATLAIGIGANTAIFAVANSLLFRPPDGITEPDRLVDIGTARGDGGLNPLSYPTYLEVARLATSFSGVFAQDMFPRVMSLGASDTAAAERVVGQSVTTNFFAVLGARPSIGRVFAAADDEAGRAAVLDHDFWIRRFNRDPGVVGRVLRLNGQPFTVVGVAAEGFQGTGIQTRDIWLARRATLKGGGSVIAGARLQPGASAPAAASEVAAIGAAVDRESGVTSRNQPLSVLPFSRAGGNRNVAAGFAGVLMTIVSLVLAVACANVAGLVLARSVERTREMALRTALGAGRGRLVRQLLTETALLFLIGGTCGLALARGIIALTPFLPSLPMPISVPLVLDWRVLIFALSISFIAALVSGLVPAFKGSKTNPGASLKEDARSSPGRSRLAGSFVVAEIAVSILLVVLAGLFVRAARYAGMASPGFDAGGVEIAALDLSMIGTDESLQTNFWRAVLERVRALPAIQTASLARVPPGGFEGIGLGSVAAADAPVGGEAFAPAWNVVDAGYFATLRIPLLAGRDFSADDVGVAPPVAIVGDAIARRFWPGQSAVGRTLIVSNTWQPERRTVLIVGVVADIKSSSLIDGLAQSYVYVPREQTEPTMTTSMTIVARSRSGGRSGHEIAAVVRALNPDLVVVRSETLQDSVAMGLAPQRLLATVAGTLGLVGLLLTSVGIYGVIAYSVVRRRQEFGIRMALGARRMSIIWMVVRHGMLLVGVGTIIGFTLAAGVGQVLSVFLYGLPAIHVPTFIGTMVLFAAVGAAACYIPARRAVNVEPLWALRGDR